MQKQIEIQPELPAQLQHLAEAQQMGEFLAAHMRNEKVYPAPVAIGLTVFLGICCIALPFTVMSWSVYLLILAALCLLLYGGLQRYKIVHRHDQVVLYANGFIAFIGGPAVVYRWDNIDYVLRGSNMSEGGEGIGDIDRITVKAGANKFTLPGEMSRHARADICDRIERGFVTARLPKIIAQYTEGGEIVFGTSPTDPNRLQVSQAGFHDSIELLPWPMVERAEVGSTLVIIRKEGRTSDWYHKLISVVPNAALLKALLEHRQYQ